MFPTVGAIREESSGRSTENLELVLGFKEKKGWIDWMEKRRN